MRAEYVPAESDYDPATYQRGPRRRRRSGPGPVYDAYTVTGALNRPCPRCGAKPREYCHAPETTDHQTKGPCVERLSERTAS